MSLKASEFILNPNGSIYHLHLKPGDIANTIITVGDPDRVSGVTKYFDSITFETHKREFKTQTGVYKGKQLTVISTGIGTDNIDIVFNELDALVNIDFDTKTIKKEHTRLDFIRIGTSGAIQPEVLVDSFLMSEKAIGFDNLLHFYGNTNFLDRPFSEAFIKQTQWSNDKSVPYVVNANAELLQVFSLPAGEVGSKEMQRGFTATNVGFYGPQGRKLRLALSEEDLNDKLQRFSYQDSLITNLEMETAGIYGLASLLGHRAISLNAILANRANGTFSADPQKTVDKLITHTLDILATL